MKLFRNILLSLLLLISSVGFTQNNLIKVSTFNRFDLLFDGVDEYLNIDNTLTNVLATTTRGTWSLWVKPVTVSGTQMLITFGDTNDDARIQLFIGESATLRVFVTDGWTLDTDDTALTIGVWTHIVLVQNGTSPVLYVDAVAVAQTFFVSPNKTKWFSNFPGLDNGRIANSNWVNRGEEFFFNGNTDEVSFWNTDLTLTQIQEIYNNGKPTNLKGHSKVANLVAWYQMGEFSSFTGGTWNIVDGSTNSNTAVSVNIEEADRILSTLTYEQPLGLLKIGNNLIVSP